MPVQVGQFRHVPGRTVKTHPSFRFIQIIKVYPETGIGSVNSAKTHDGTGPVHPVQPCLFHRTVHQLSVSRGHEPLDLIQPLTEVGNVHRFLEFMIEADDIYILFIPGIDGRRSQDIVQHGITVHRVIQKLPDTELLIGNKDKAIVVNVKGVGNQILKISDR